MTGYSREIRGNFSAPARALHEWLKLFSEKSDCRDVAKAKGVELVTIFVLFDMKLIF